MDLTRLLERAAQGDRAAQESLLADFYPRVRESVHQELSRDFRRHHRWMLPLFSTGDIVQEVFASVITSLERFEVQDETSFVRYLTTLVKHRILDAVRFHEAGRRDQRRLVASPEEEIPHASADPTPSMAASLQEQLATYRDVLATLPEKQRLLLDLRLVEELPFEEIAQRLAIASADAARKAFHDAQAKLLVKLRARGMPGDTR